jgi:hypothetical protein
LAAFEEGLSSVSELSSQIINIMQINSLVLKLLCVSIKTQTEQTKQLPHKVEIASKN